MPLEEIELPSLEKIKNAKNLLSDFKKSIKAASKEFKPLKKQGFPAKKVLLQELELPEFKKLSK